MSYPYQGEQQTCNAESVPIVEGTKGITFTDVPEGDFDQLIQAVLKQPVSVAVSSKNWGLYDSGIFDLDCSGELDHAVLLVGYVKDEYLYVKNSWSFMWGESGYIKLKYGNSCGIANDASYPSLA
eukprot:CAMPEP_0168314306 /NCGR_PEP_ID=MMETSP0210-20121227/7109_1 /TAXON_ID=40633 /ORGANISM="Condylostoma magnum, Strain COL2" /LENGTH=124 /DNA_ID=CAMNT_0008280331 /DNA_START=664 /DNA_END=1034 /DNA_ORIENTATION=+